MEISLQLIFSEEFFLPLFTESRFLEFSKIVPLPISIFRSEKTQESYLPTEIFILKKKHAYLLQHVLQIDNILPILSIKETIIASGFQKESMYFSSLSFISVLPPSYAR